MLRESSAIFAEKNKTWPTPRYLLNMKILILTPHQVELILKNLGNSKITASAGDLNRILDAAKKGKKKL